MLGLLLNGVAMARISELHYSNAYARSSGVSEFLETALRPSENPADFTVSFYQSDGTVGFELALDAAAIPSFVDPDNNEVIFVISADNFPILLTDPDGGGATNYEAYALTNTTTGEVVDFYDIGGGTQTITAVDGVASGAESVNLPVLVGPNQTTSTLQFNQPNPDMLVYGTVAPGDTGLACFVAGTAISTAEGKKSVECILPGDLLETRDNGKQTVRWVGHSEVAGVGRFAPVRITRGTLGAKRDLFVSPQHRILVEGWQSELFFGASELLVPALALINGTSVRRVAMQRVTYVHVMFDQHQILDTHGVQSESFFPGDTALRGMVGETRDELFALFPELENRPGRYGQLCRPAISAREGALLRA